jgi:hypothetical protein
MAKLNKIDSNSTASSYCEEASLGVLPAAASQVWTPLEPNSYSDFGGQVTTVARNPINSGRQRKKGVVTDIEASGGLNSDITQTNIQGLMQGFTFSDLRRKNEKTAITSVTAGTKKYALVTSGYRVGDLVFFSGFANAANNGLKRVTAVDGTDVTVAETVVDETVAGSVKAVAVGFQFTAADATIDGDGASLPALETTTKDLTQLGLIPGEFIFIGGDGAAEKFATAANNGFARVRSVAAGVITFDKTSDTMVDDAGTGKTLRVFFGRVLKNEVGTLIKRRSYTLERRLGANDDSDLTREQAEYLEGAIASEFSLNVPTAEKATVDISFMALRNSTIDENISGANTLLTKVASVVNTPLIEADAFNTSSDVSRIKLASVVAGQPNPEPLFAFVQEFSLTVNNNLTGNKAVGVTGSFEVTAGTFEVGGNITAYFSDVAAVEAVKNNADITLEAHFVKSNAGITFDVPLITLGDGRPNVEQDQAITLPLETMAATGAKIDPNLNHTLLIVFWDYLPNAADL